MSNKTKKQLLLNLPYFIAGLVCTNLGEAWRIAEGADMSEKLLGFLSALGAAFSNPMPSLHPMDLLIGVCCGAGLRLAVYLKGKNAKKYRHGMEYGSARWGTQKDIEPFEDPVFANNVILTRTERLMMGNRPKNPANARNKNVLVVGGSGSGKTRFWLKPNLLQCHSSYVVTDPKGDIVRRGGELPPLYIARFLIGIGNLAICLPICRCTCRWKITIHKPIRAQRTRRYTFMAFFNSAVTVLQTLVIALGAGLGIWGAINLLEGYGNDNPGANAHVR